MAEEKAKYTRLPFALCMDYGIHIEDWWMPKDAWDALKRKGVVESVAQEYKKHYSALKEKKSNYINERDVILLPDENVPHSVGAKWENEKIKLPDGTTARFVEGTKLQNKEVFAGKGCKRKIDCLDRLVKTYPGSVASEWMKVKAIAVIELPNEEIVEAEIHWYEEKNVGKHDFKVKEK